MIRKGVDVGRAPPAGFPRASLVPIESSRATLRSWAAKAKSFRPPSEASASLPMPATWPVDPVSPPHRGPGRAAGLRGPHFFRIAKAKREQRAGRYLLDLTSSAPVSEQGRRGDARRGEPVSAYAGGLKGAAERLVLASCSAIWRKGMGGAPRELPCCDAEMAQRLVRSFRR